MFLFFHTAPEDKGDIVDKNFERILNLIEESGEKKKTNISIQEYQNIINRSITLWMSNGVDEAFSFIRSYFNFVG